MTEPSSADRRLPSPAMILAVVGFSVFVAADDLTVVSTMLRPIIGDLGLELPDGLDDAAWVVNAYLIAFIAIMPIAGRLSDVFGRRRAFVGAYLTFIAGSILIPLSIGFDQPFRWFLVGRILTALGGGAMVPVALAVIGDVYPADRRIRALGTLGAIETIGWVWGPLYGAMLVRFLTWEWQFWLNVPLGAAGLIASWHVLAGHDEPRLGARVDWLGAALLTVTLTSLNVALLSGANVQSVNGLDELTGGGGANLRWLYLVAVAAGATLVWQQRRSSHPLVDRRLFRSRRLLVALVVNFVVGAGLVIAMVDVPLFINSVEGDLERSAVVAGYILSAMTAAMSIMSYVGGRLTERFWFRPPVLAGVSMSALSFAWMGATWSADTSYPVFLVQLALLGAGFGLTVAPTTSAVVEEAPEDQRGAAASVVLVVRLLGLSVGLSALTAWGLARFQSLRSQLDLPPLTDPRFQEALVDAQAKLTAESIAQTFTAAAVIVGAGLLATLALRRTEPAAPMEPNDGGAIATTPDVDDTDDVDDVEDIDEPAFELVDDIDDIDEPAIELVPALVSAQLGEMTRRMHLMIGALGLLLTGAFVAILLLAGRVSDARDDASAARAELALTRDDLDRVEAGAALYASQIDGFQQQLTELEPEISAGVEQAIAGLRTFNASTISFNVPIDEVIPIQTEVVINRTVQVPIKTTIPINQSFDTTIRVSTPFGSVPLDITVPVDVDVPVDLTVDIPINETVPISDEFAVKLDIPIAIDVSETELGDLTEALATGLESMQKVLSGLSGS
ncbi:MAG: MFS transporter [Ilumatobacteraceae bacterium]